MRILETGSLKSSGSYDIRILKTGVLVQDRDQPVPTYRAFLKKNLKFVTKARLKPSEIASSLVEKAKLDTVMTNSFGFGGTNGSMLLSNYKD